MTILNLDLLYPCLTTAPGWPSVHPIQMLGKIPTPNPEGALASLSYSRVPGCSWAADIIGELFDKAGSSVALSGDGKRLAVGAPGHSPGGCNGAGCKYRAGRVSVYGYTWVCDGGCSWQWQQIGDHIVGDRCDSGCGLYNDNYVSDGLGRSVSLSYDGKYVAVGAYMFVRVYEWQYIGGGSVWNPHYAADSFGFSSASTKLDEDGRYTGYAQISGDGNRLAVAAGSWRRADGGSAQGTQARLRVFERVPLSIETDYWVKLGADLPSVNAGWDGGRSPSTSISQDGSIVSFSGGGQNFCWMNVVKYNEGSSSWEQMGSTVKTEIDGFTCGGTRGCLSKDGLSIAVRQFYYDSMPNGGYEPATVDLRRWDPSTSSWAFVDGTRLKEPLQSVQTWGFEDVALAGNVTRLAVGIPHPHTSDNAICWLGASIRLRRCVARGSISCRGRTELRRGFVLLLRRFPRHRRYRHDGRRVHDPHVHIQRHVPGDRPNTDRDGRARRWRRRRRRNGCRRWRWRRRCTVQRGMEAIWC